MFKTCYNKIFSKSTYNELNTTIKLNYSVIGKYNEYINNGKLNRDENQIKIIEKLNKFYENFETLNKEDKSSTTTNYRKESFFSKFFKSKNASQLDVQLKGIYLWGGVGCGVGNILLCDF